MLGPSLIVLVTVAMIVLVEARTVVIDEDNFERRVANSGLVWAIEFSSSMCGSCAEFKPRWKEGAAQLEAIGVRTGVVEVDDPAGMNLAQRLGVLDAGLPAVRVFSRDEAGPEKRRLAEPDTLEIDKDGGFEYQLKIALGFLKSFKEHPKGYRFRERGQGRDEL